MPDDDRIEDHEQRLREMEKSYGKINHFTEDFPKLMDVKLEHLKSLIKLNRGLIIAVLLTIISSAVGIIAAFLQTQ